MNDYVGPNYFSFHSMWFLDGVGWFQNVGTSIVSAPDHGFWTYPFPINIPKHVFGEVETDAYRGSYREIPVETKLASFTREGATTCVRDGLYFKIRSNLLFTGVPTSDPENYNVEGPTKLAHNSTKYALITRSDGKTYDIYAGWSPIGYGDGSYTIGFPYSLLFDYDNLIYVPNRKTKERITVTVCHIYRYEAYGYYLSSLGTRIYEIFEFNEDYTLREHRIEIPHTKEKIIL
jgi:hypothetical protein